MGGHNYRDSISLVFAYPIREFTVKTATVTQPSVVLPIVYNGIVLRK